jgi:hypothetical protein
MKQGHKDELYQANEGRILGSEEFVTETKKRIGEIPRGARNQVRPGSRMDPKALIEAAARVTGFEAQELCSAKKGRALVRAKEAMIVVGREMGASNAALARLMGLDVSVVSRRHESGRAKMKESKEERQMVSRLRAELAGKA